MKKRRQREDEKGKKRSRPEKNKVRQEVTEQGIHAVETLDRILNSKLNEQF